MGYEVVLAQGVALEVKEIVGYLESIVGKSSGIAFMKAFAAKIELISQFPHQFPKSDRFKDARKCIVYSNYLIYFRIFEGKTVQVVTVRHAKSARA